MDPGRDITAQARKILKQSKPADSRPPDRKIRPRFQSAFDAAIAVFSMAVFFYGMIVDVLSIGRCWSNKPSIQHNGTFRATIFEGGSNMDYTVSLYAVGYGLNKTIEQWLSAGLFGGLPMIPQQYRLDSIMLSLNGV